ncbi:aminotransferase class V-fold PLP-dependent enzyme [Clostridium brassicae]|uniref:Aminotransferase class V-fold PLP-dependent enzyme n=1 Tax=Clostridium brassicae TaxID=2999072 RepID=A0ABT4DCU7_9CLOT|nr:aminotransferase class V-fold PLP-dependent enzyme [Clostridium brassicae]MCY6960133.1 aminotransferase class V-fold PLP-dependent enzyme [Clostridium brassicae]
MLLSNLSRYIEGANIPVETLDGKIVKRVYFNNSGTALALRPVICEVNKNIPFITYTEAAGYLGKRNTKKYEYVREIILDYVGGDVDKDEVIYVHNSTEGINLLADLFYQEDSDQVVITTSMEHMANYLPFKSRFKIATVDITKEGDLDIDDLVYKLTIYKNKVKLVAVTGASNVTGIGPPIYKIAQIVHDYGAKILVDAVQLVQHRPFSMKPHNNSSHIDFVVFSAHKCYTPFDGGALIGPSKFFAKYLPPIQGSDNTSFVSSEKVIYAPTPHRYEAGFPNIFGVMAMGAALKFLKSQGLKNIAEYEKRLYYYLKSGLESIPRVIIYGQESNNIIIPYISFNVEGINYSDVGNYLVYEHGIEVAAGIPGANIYIEKLLDVSPEEAYRRYKSGNPIGIVRASLGMYNTFSEIDRLIKALRMI